MNFYLLQLVSKWISLITLSMMSFFGFNVEEKQYAITNDNLNKNLPVVVEVVGFETKTNFNSSLTSNTKNVLTKGQNGLAFINASGEKIILEEPVTEEIELGTAKLGVYNGIMTAYGADCAGCSKVGNVACKTEDGKRHSLVNDGVYYSDDTYGKVRIMAAALSEFPCGTIVRVENSNIDDFVGIVMDTGGDMREALNEGIYHFDLAFVTEKDPEVPNVTNRKGTIIYTVERWGW